MRSARTAQQKLSLYSANAVIAACAAQSLLNRYVFRPLRPLRWRSVALCRSSYDVLTAAPAGRSPNTTSVSTRSTRPRFWCWMTRP